MQEGFIIAIDWKNRKNVPNLPVEEILDKVADTIIEMSIENGKMARTLHEVILRIVDKDVLVPADIIYLRNAIIGNLGSHNACPVAKEEHQDRRTHPHGHDR